MVYGHDNSSNGLANIIIQGTVDGGQGRGRPMTDGSTILHGGQDRQQKQSTGTHMIEL